MSLRVNIDYADGQSNRGPGVFVTRDGQQVASWNTGVSQADWSAFIDWAFEREEEVTYGTSITSSNLYQDILSQRS